LVGDRTQELPEYWLAFDGRVRSSYSLQQEYIREMDKHRQIRFFQGITRNILILGLVSLFTDLSSQMVFPLIPLFLTTVLGAGACAVGIVEGAAETTGYLVFAVTSIGLIFTSSIYTILIFFIVYGVFYAMIDGVQRALVVDLAPGNLKATALGTFHTAIGLVALPGGYVAGLLWDKIGPGATFTYGFTLAIISIALFMFVKPTSRVSLDKGGLRD